jgi:hypothetical protein
MGEAYPGLRPNTTIGGEYGFEKSCVIARNAFQAHPEWTPGAYEEMIFAVADIYQDRVTRGIISEDA